MIFLLLFSFTTIEITPDTATVGDPMEAIIKGGISDSISIMMPDSFPDIVLLDTIEVHGDTLASLRFVSFSTGHQNFQLNMNNDTLKVAYFIKSVLTPENKGLSPIYGPYGFFNWYNLFWGLILPFGFLVYYLIMRRKKDIIMEEPEKEPGEEALGNLSILEDKIDQWNWNKIYTSLSYIVRRYIERKEGIPAVEATTSELLRIFKRGDSREFKPVLNQLPRWDLIKFADVESSSDEFRGDIATTRSVIQSRESKEDDTL